MLIKDYCIKGLMDEARQLLEKMREDGCSPDDCAYSNTISRGCILNNDLTNAS
ncbi:hypothetical protein RDABS01_030062 [Bienertia sinuspersici]